MTSGNFDGTMVKKNGSDMKIRLPDWRTERHEFEKTLLSRLSAHAGQRERIRGTPSVTLGMCASPRFR